MPNRASQFMPFDALKGYREALEQVEKIVENKKQLDFDYLNELDKKLKQIKINDKVYIKYYYNYEYNESIDIVKKIDYINKNITFKNIKIDVDDILNIEKV